MLTYSTTESADNPAERLPAREIIRLLAKGPRSAAELAAAAGADPDGVADQLAVMADVVPDLVDADGDRYRLGAAGLELVDITRRTLTLDRREAELEALIRQARTPSVRAPKTAISQRAAEREIPPERLAKGDVGDVDPDHLKRLRLDTEHPVDRPLKMRRDTLMLMARRSPKTGKPGLTDRQLAAGRRMQDLSDLAKLDRLPAHDPAINRGDGGGQRAVGLTDCQADALAAINRACQFVHSAAGPQSAVMVRSVLVDRLSLDAWLETGASRGLPRRRVAEAFRRALDVVADAFDVYGDWGRDGPPLGDAATPGDAGGSKCHIIRNRT